MPHTEYEDLVVMATEANERSRDNEIELEKMQERFKVLGERLAWIPKKLESLVSRMNTQDKSLDLMREKIEELNEEAKLRIAFLQRVDRYLKECCGVSQEAKETIECDRPAIDQRVLADES